GCQIEDDAFGNSTRLQQDRFRSQSPGGIQIAGLLDCQGIIARRQLVEAEAAIQRGGARARARSAQRDARRSDRRPRDGVAQAAFDDSCGFLRAEQCGEERDRKELHALFRISVGGFIEQALAPVWTAIGDERRRYRKLAKRLSLTQISTEKSASRRGCWQGHPRGRGTVGRRRSRTERNFTGLLTSGAGDTFRPSPQFPRRIGGARDLPRGVAVQCCGCTLYSIQPGHSAGTPIWWG